MTGGTLPARDVVAPLKADATLPRRDRLLYVDNVRVALITLVVIGHIAVMYGAPGDWFYYEVSEPSAGAFIFFTFLLGIGASFLMGLFYLIAAYLTPRAYDRKGAKRFVADRLLRLGVPLLIFAFLFNPITTCAVEAHSGESSFWRCLPANLPSMEGFGVSVMWFVELLLIFSLLYALWRQVSRRLGSEGRGERARPRTIPGNGAVALFALALGLVTFLIRLWAPVDWRWEPWHLEPAHLPQYVFFFIAGILAYRDGWFEGLLEARFPTWRWIALAGALSMPVLAIAAGALSGELSDDGAGGWNWLSLAYSVWEGFTGVAMTITVLAWVRRRFNTQCRLVRTMAASSYAVYFLHPPLIVLLALALSGIDLNAGLKFILVAPLGVALCYLVAYAVRQAPGIGRIL